VKAAKISERDIIESVAEALQYISYFHPPDFVEHLHAAYEREASVPAKNAIAQILANSRMAAFGKRPICQDTGVVVIFAKIGMQTVIESRRPLIDLINEGVRLAYLNEENPLRASMIVDPINRHQNSGDNTPAVLHTELVAGNTIDFHVTAKGGGSENKARYTNLNPAEDLVDWVVDEVDRMGSGWCPPGLISIGVGGTAEKAMLIAKEALNEPVNMSELLLAGPKNQTEELRIELYERLNALGVGAQGLGGLTTVVDVKLSSYPCHAASKPVALIPQCAASRHISFSLDGRGAAVLPKPDLTEWPQVDGDFGLASRRINIDTATREDLFDIPLGEQVLLSGTIYSARDAAHKRIAEYLEAGRALPVNLKGKFLYYVGPVKAVDGEVVGPAGPTTSARMDRFTELMLKDVGILGMVGKAERGTEVARLIASHKAPYFIAVGGAAYLISKSIKKAEIVAFDDLGMEAIHRFEITDMPVTMAIDSNGNSIHEGGKRRWRNNEKIGGNP
jgi:fumarate hydratase class I